MASDTAQPGKPTVIYNPLRLNWKNVAAGTVIALLMVAIGVFSFTYYNPNATPVPPVVIKSGTQSAKTSKATPSAEKKETADWKTYTNKKTGFSIKYPPSKFCSTKKIEERETNLSIKEAKSEVLFKAFDCLSDFSVLISITGKDYLGPGSKFGDFDLINESSIKVIDKGATKKTYGADPGSFDLVIVKDNENTYVFQYYGRIIYEQKEGDEISEAGFDLMLSTFKFLD